jgi:hypothetical protein
MKLNYNPTPDFTFILEGTPEEIRDFVEITVRDAARPAPRVTNVQVIEPKPVKASKPSVKYTSSVLSQSHAETTTSFLRSIFVYEPNPASKSGRGAWIAQQILKGNTLNVHRLAAQAQSTTHTVFKTITRMQDAGAQIDVHRNTVRLITIPEPPYAIKFKSNRKPRGAAAQTSEAQPSVALDRAGTLLDALKSFKVD